MKKVGRKSQGTKRMQELGYKPLQLWLPPSTETNLKTVAAAWGKSKTATALDILQNYLCYNPKETK